MAFASGSITFKRFFVNGAAYKRVDEPLLEKLAARAITADSIRTADATEIGWITGEHILDVDFDFAKNAVADGLHFALRIDTNKPPTELVRSYQRQSEQAMLEAGGREFLTKVQRREAREQAIARADAEARSGSFRRMRQVPVFWDLPRNEVYLAATSPSVVDHFLLLFRQTFDRSLVAASSGEMAARWAGKAGEARAFDECRPAHFINPPEGAADLAGMAGTTSEGRSRDFLGTEWLTWLWYSSHVESPEVATPDGEPITVLFHKSLQLECAFKVSGSMSLQAEGPTGQPEALVALAGGKRPVRAGLQVASRGEAFSLAIRGDAMNFTAVQLQPPDEVAESRVVFEDRISKLRDLIGAAEQLYVAFLKRRLSGKWTATLNAMRSWIAAGRHAGYTADESLVAPVTVAS